MTESVQRLSNIDSALRDIQDGFALHDTSVEGPKRYRLAKQRWMKAAASLTSELHRSADSICSECGQVVGGGQPEPVDPRAEDLLTFVHEWLRWYQEAEFCELEGKAVGATPPRQPAQGPSWMSHAQRLELEPRSGEEPPELFVVIADDGAIECVKEIARDAYLSGVQACGAKPFTIFRYARTTEPGDRRNV